MKDRLNRITTSPSTSNNFDEPLLITHGASCVVLWPNLTNIYNCQL